MILRRLWPALLPLVLLAAAACGDGSTNGATQAGDGPLRVATSISVFSDMIRQVGGERVSVLSLIPPAPTRIPISRGRRM